VAEQHYRQESSSSSSSGSNGNGVSKRILLDQATLVPIGFLLTIAGAFTWAAMWLTGKFDSMGQDVREVKYKVERIEEHLNDRITRSEIENWILRFYAANPALGKVDLPR